MSKYSTKQQNTRNKNTATSTMESRISGSSGCGVFVMSELTI